MLRIFGAESVMVTDITPLSKVVASDFVTCLMITLAHTALKLRRQPSASAHFQPHGVASWRRIASSLQALSSENRKHSPPQPMSFLPEWYVVIYNCSPRAFSSTELFSDAGSSDIARGHQETPGSANDQNPYLFWGLRPMDI